MTYRSPAQLADGGVLVVGGSATGVQLADEIQRSGRQVTLAVGEHVRMPRTYRGRDIFWWLDAAGVLDERHDEVDDLVRARHVPSPQLVGTPERRSIDLNTLAELGVDVVGRLGAVRDGVAPVLGCPRQRLPAGRPQARSAPRPVRPLGDRARRSTRLDGADRPAPTRVPGGPAAGDRPPSPRHRHRRLGHRLSTRTTPGWTLPVLDRRGRIRHDGGVVHGAPGLYLLGGNLLRTAGRATSAAPAKTPGPSPSTSGATWPRPPGALVGGRRHLTPTASRRLDSRWFAR